MENVVKLAELVEVVCTNAACGEIKLNGRVAVRMANAMASIILALKGETDEYTASDAKEEYEALIEEALAASVK